MKRILGIFVVLALAALAAFAGSDKMGGKQTLNGTLVDVSCAMENAQKPKADFATKHSKQCLQMPECVETGYGLLTPDNKFTKFDADSNKQVEKFIADTDKNNDWKVTVTGSMNKDNTIKVESIKLQ